MTNNNDTNSESNEMKTSQKSSYWETLLAFKSLIVSIFLAGLLITNIATVVNSTAHDWMHRLVWTVLSIGGELLVNKAMSDSPKMKAAQQFKAQTAELEAKNKQLSATVENQNKQIKKLDASNKDLAKDMENKGKWAKETAIKVRKRLGAGVLRNVTALPSKVAPYIGATVVVAFTTIDIYDACETMKDFNSLLVRLGEGEEEPDICGQKVPSAEEIKESAQKMFKKKEGG